MVVHQASDLTKPVKLLDYLGEDVQKSMSIGIVVEDIFAPVTASSVDASRGTHFSLPDHGLQASIDGAGVVLGWRTLAAPDIAARRVVAPFDLVLPLGSSFYLTYPEAHAPRPNIAALRDWLVSEVRES